MTQDPFAALGRSLRQSLPSAAKGHHEERAHSKFSASGAERWFNCSGSVALSEGIPSKQNAWSIEGTQAHEVLEGLMLHRLGRKDELKGKSGPSAPSPEMLALGSRAADFIIGVHKRLPGSEIMVETRIHLEFIHPEMFGTFDGAVVDPFGTLHVFDYKYGKSPVSPKENLQMIFYGIGLAHKFHWNFKRVRLWILQPRIRSYEGPLFWEITTGELETYVSDFRIAVAKAINEPKNYREGTWCHFCVAKEKCPLKQDKKIEKAKSIFSINPIAFPKK